MSEAGQDIAARLIRWYRRAHRDLPWRRTREPWPILVSEIMLQQTRVQTVLPYYEQFLKRFPTPERFALASESEVLAAWSGLGYYSRARNLHEAARQIADTGQFPDTYEGLRALPGIGDYTAAAVASICYGLPHAVVDGNVLRVVARVTNDAGDIKAPATKAKFARLAQEWMDAGHPAVFNQALMELGATVCVPRNPMCLICPLEEICEGRAAGVHEQLPVKPGAAEPRRLEIVQYVIERAGRILLWQRGAESSRMRGFWELPSGHEAPEARGGETLGTFGHTITHHHYTVAVVRAKITKKPERCEWVSRDRLAALPLSTIARKALRFAVVKAL